MCSKSSKGTGKYVRKRGTNAWKRDARKRMMNEWEYVRGGVRGDKKCVGE